MSTPAEQDPRKENKSPFLLDVRVNGSPYDPSITALHSGDRVDISIPEAAFAEHGGFYVFVTPLAKYEDDYKTIFIYDGEETDLGVLPSLTVSGERSTTLTLAEDSLYDIFYPHSGVIDPVRFTTGTEPIPQSLTFDESKLLLAIRSGKKPHEIAGINATIVANKELLRNRHEYLYYGFQVGDLVATISKQSIFGMFFVDTKDFWRTVSGEEFGKHLEQLKNSL